MGRAVRQTHRLEARGAAGERIAKSVRGFMDAGRRPGEVLVLVNRRGALFEAIIRALKNAGIPVAGADRLVLTEHIAVMDLMVLADALLLPQDDLALATVLKSPLFGFDDDDIFALAYDRGAKSLRRALIGKSAGNKKFAAALTRLDELSRRARNDTPFAFYARLLGAERGRERFLARLGHEAADALDEFLNLALDYERDETPSLQGFVAWLRAAKCEHQARHGNGARRGARHDGTWRQGARSADRDSRRHHDPPEGHHPPPLVATASTAPARSPLVWAKAKRKTSAR